MAHSGTATEKARVNAQQAATHESTLAMHHRKRAHTPVNSVITACQRTCFALLSCLNNQTMFVGDP